MKNPMTHGIIKNAKAQLVFCGCFPSSISKFSGLDDVGFFENPGLKSRPNQIEGLKYACYCISVVYFPVWVKLFGMIRLPIQCLMSM